MIPVPESWVLEIPQPPPDQALQDQIPESKILEVLAEAASTGALDCCKDISERCPSLLYKGTSESGYTALHHAAKAGHLHMVEYLITADSEADWVDWQLGGGRKLPNKKLLMMQARSGETALHVAVVSGQHEVLKLLLQVGRDFGMLQTVDRAGRTCLHYAAEQSDHVAAELIIEATLLFPDQESDHVTAVSIIEARPDYEYLKMTTSSMQTALHIAAEKDSVAIVKLLLKADHHNELVRMVDCYQKTALRYAAERDSEEVCKLLMEKDPSQCTIQIGDMGWTQLHYATSYGCLSLIKDIIRLCSNCPKQVDSHGQTFIHIAAKLGLLDVVKYCLERKEIDATILNTQDMDGNTPLHIAALSKNKSVVLSLLYDARVSKGIENTKKEKAIDLINFPYDEAKARVYSIGHQRDLKDQSSFDLLVAALIATVSFTAGITVPGGYVSDGINKGTAISLKGTAFKVFVISNNLALLFSLYTVFLNFSTRRLLKEEDIYYESSLATFAQGFYSRRKI